MEYLTVFYNQIIYDFATDSEMICLPYASKIKLLQRKDFEQFVKGRNKDNYVQ